ncbi:hypothetical protein [Salipiger pallidus]|uniref:hypothetical protein n=1 Tax=Salipiger pallidus TaxID=1775170 RepID=UPI00166D4E46|nr:hypothetical protein [Salipiger pallidus]
MTSASGYGFTYQSSLSEISMLAPENTARANAGFFIYAYSGFTIPVIATDGLADGIGLVPAKANFSAVQLACLASLALAWRSRLDGLEGAEA